MKIILTKGLHLTALDKKIIKSCIVSGNTIASTKQKKLFITGGDGNGEYKADLFSFENGIGIGAPMKWNKKQIEFKILK